MAFVLFFSVVPDFLVKLKVYRSHFYIVLSKVLNEEPINFPFYFVFLSAGLTDQTLTTASYLYAT